MKLSELQKNGIYEMIFNEVSDMVFVMEVCDGPSFKYVIANEAAKKHACLTADCYGKQLHDVLPRDSAQYIHNQYLKALSLEEPYVFEDFVNSGEGSFYGESKLTVFTDEKNKTYILSITRDVTDRKKYEKELERLAYEDYLTGLLNRRVFEQKLEKIVQNKHSKFAYMLIDFDYFKQINDQYGHDVGDKCLIELAKIMKSTVEEDDFIARIGGDEFVIIKNYETKDEIIGAAENLIQRSKTPIKIDDLSIHYSLSIGISFYPEDGREPSTIMKNADIALYRAKEEGRRQYNFFEVKKTR